jgi:hypothetical protein
MKESLLTVFSTASSMAGLPKTMRCLTTYGAEEPTQLDSPGLYQSLLDQQRAIS